MTLGEKLKNKSNSDQMYKCTVCICVGNNCRERNCRNKLNANHLFPSNMNISRIIHTCCKHWKCCPGQSLMSCPGKEAVSCLTLLMGKYGFPFFFWLNWKKTCLVLQSRLLLNDKNMTFYQCLPVATWYVLCALPCSLLPFLISVNIFSRI